MDAAEYNREIYDRLLRRARGSRVKVKFTAPAACLAEVSGEPYRPSAPAGRRDLPALAAGGAACLLFLAAAFFAPGREADTAGRSRMPARAFFQPAGETAPPAPRPAMLSSAARAAEESGEAAAGGVAKALEESAARLKIEKGLKLYNESLTNAELSKLSSAILKASKKFSLPAELITGIVITESRGEARARSHAGAYGPMQVMYSVHGKSLKKFGINKAEDLYDVEKGVTAGSWIFKGYLERTGSVRKALGRYYGASSKAYINGTLRRAAAVSAVRPAPARTPKEALSALKIGKEDADRLFRLVYASTLAGLDAEGAAAWLAADSPELPHKEKVKTLALLRYFGEKEDGGVLCFPKPMADQAKLSVALLGEKDYLKKIRTRLAYAYAAGTGFEDARRGCLAGAMAAEKRERELDSGFVSIHAPARGATARPGNPAGAQHLSI